MSTINNSINNQVIVSSGSANMPPRGTVVMTAASQQNALLPLSTACQVGDTVTIIGTAANVQGFGITQNASQTIYYKGVGATTGTSHGWVVVYNVSTPASGNTIVEIIYLGSNNFAITNLNGTLQAY